MALCEEGVIKGSLDPDKAAGPSAFDLTLAGEGWLMRGSVKGNPTEAYEQTLSESAYRTKRIDLSRPVVLEPRCTYLIRLAESLDLSAHPDLHGVASGKSSVGRLDVLVRLIADYAPGFDQIVPSRRSKRHGITLYAEVTPISFPIQVQAGVSLNQLRLFMGEDYISELGPGLLKYYANILLHPDRSLEHEDELQELTVDITPVVDGEAAGLIGFEGLRDIRHPIPLLPGTPGADPRNYWKPVAVQESGERLEIVPERFYILRSRERFRLPPEVAAFVQAMSERLGELRIHYAGFVHPGFGWLRPEGTPLIFETRGHNITTFLRHAERMAVIRYYQMSEPVDEETIAAESYQHQELTLSRYFAPWR